jgi:hypothetical protein
MPQDSKTKSPLTLDFLRIAPIRGVIINEDFEEDKGGSSLPKSMEFFFNPDNFNFTTQASWARIAVPGLSHEVLQWSHTASNEMSFNVQWDWIIAAQREKGVFNKYLPKLSDKKMESIRKTSHNKAMLYRDFLYALTLPVERGRAPSRVSIIWPDVVHIRGVVPKVSFKFTSFNQEGGVRAFNADLDFIELRRVFLGRQGTGNYFTRLPDDPPADQVSYIKDDSKFGSTPKSTPQKQTTEIGGGMSVTSPEALKAVEDEAALEAKINRTWAEPVTQDRSTKVVSPYRLE